MGDIDFNACASDIILCGGSGFVIANMTYDEDPIMFTTYTYLLFHGLLGVLRHGHVQFMPDEVKKMHDISDLIAIAMPLCLYTTDYLLRNDFTPLVAYCHAGSGIAPLCGEIVNSDMNVKWFDMVILGNVCSLGFFAMMKHDYMVCSLAVFCGATHFGSQSISERLEINAHSLETVSLAGLVVLSFITLKK